EHRDCGRPVLSAKVSRLDDDFLYRVRVGDGIGWAAYRDVVVFYSIDLEVVSSGPLAIDGKVKRAGLIDGPAGRTGYARHDLRQRQGIDSGQGQLLYGARLKVATPGLLRFVQLDFGGRGFHSHRLLRGSDFQGEVDGGYTGCLNLESGLLFCGETGGLGGQIIRSQIDGVE